MRGARCYDFEPKRVESLQQRIGQLTNVRLNPFRPQLLNQLQRRGESNRSQIIRRASGFETTGALHVLVVLDGRDGRSLKVFSPTSNGILDIEISGSRRTQACLGLAVDVEKSAAEW